MKSHSEIKQSMIHYIVSASTSTTNVLDNLSSLITMAEKLDDNHIDNQMLNLLVEYHFQAETLREHLDQVYDWAGNLPPLDLDKFDFKDLPEEQSEGFVPRYWATDYILVFVLSIVVGAWLCLLVAYVVGWIG